MLLVSTPIKRFFQNISILFYILIIFYFSWANPLKADSSPFTYDELLNQVRTKIKAFEYGRALDRLEIARKKKEKPDYRYYYLLGETYFQMGKIIEALDSFEESLSLEPGQMELLDRLALFYENDRRPKKSLEMIQKQLKFEPNNKKNIFRAAILANRIGESNGLNQYFLQLESDLLFKKEKDAIQTNILEKIHEKNWKEAHLLTEKYILYFPRDEVIHESKILCERAIQDPNLERSMVDAVATFNTNPNLAIRYGIYLLEKSRMLEALSAFRRAFDVSLVHSIPGNREEIFFLIRQTYTFLNREHDANAMSSLQNLSRNIKSLTDSDIDQALKSYPKNREILVFSLAYFKTNNDKIREQELIERLQSRDLENEQNELFFVIGPFPKKY